MLLVPAATISAAPAPSTLPQSRPIKAGEHLAPTPAKGPVPAAAWGAAALNALPGSAASKGMGLASLAIGIVGILFSILPLIGLVISSLGLALGAGGMVTSPKRKGLSAGIATAGLAISSAGFVFAVLQLATAHGLTRKAVDFAANLSPEKAIGDSIVVPRRETTTNHPPLPAISSEPTTPMYIEFDRNEALEVGNVKVAIAEIRIGKVPVKDFAREGESSQDMLMIKMAVTNTSTGSPVQFSGWPGRHLFLSNVGAQDEHGNRYPTIQFGATAHVVGDESGTTINPGQTAHCIIVFDTPKDSTRELHLELDGRAVEAPNEILRWKLVRSDWGG